MYGTIKIYATSVWLVHNYLQYKWNSRIELSLYDTVMENLQGVQVFADRRSVPLRGDKQKKKKKIAHIYYKESKHYNICYLQ